MKIKLAKCRVTGCTLYRSVYMVGLCGEYGESLEPERTTATLLFIVRKRVIQIIPYKCRTVPTMTYKHWCELPLSLRASATAISTMTSNVRIIGVQQRFKHRARPLPYPANIGLQLEKGRSSRQAWSLGIIVIIVTATHLYQAKEASSSSTARVIRSAQVSMRGGMSSMPSGRINCLDVLER